MSDFNRQLKIFNRGNEEERANALNAMLDIESNEASEIDSFDDNDPDYIQEDEVEDCKCFGCYYIISLI